MQRMISDADIGYEAGPWQMPNALRDSMASLRAGLQPGAKELGYGG